MNHSKYIWTYLIPGILVLGACTKGFNGLNKTQNEPTTTTIYPQVNNLESTLFLQWDEQASLHNDYYYEVSQLAGETSLSGYLPPSGINAIWGDYYNALQNFNEVQLLINQEKDQQAFANIQAILYILRAYKTFRITDQFGDIPYFKAGWLFETQDSVSIRPPYDAQQTIYDSLLANLTWACKNINTAASPVSASGNTYASLGAYDVLYAGNMTQWLKIANSLRLRYAMQMYPKDPTDATPVIQDALSGTYPLIDSGNDFCMWPASLGNYDLSSRWWSFSSGGTGFVRISSTTWNLMADGLDTPSVFDPRAWLFTTTNQAGAYNPFIIGTSTGDVVNAYPSATDPTQKNGCVYSPFNWYLIRDEWYIPELLMTAAEVHFLKAEAYAEGIGVTQSIANAQTEYQAGITSSVNFWYNISAKTSDPTEDWEATTPAPPTAAQMQNLFTNPKVAFTGTQADALSKIYAQEWLSFYRQPWLAWNLWRRTGFATPKDPASNPNSTYTTYFRLVYPLDEANNNTVNYSEEVAKQGPDINSTKVWWQP